jgi:hypothetical protein
MPLKQEDYEKLPNLKKPSEIEIHEIHSLFSYGVGYGKVGTFNRKAKGTKYESPRILLNRYFMKYVNRDFSIMEGKASIKDKTWSGYQNRDILVLFF